MLINTRFQPSPGIIRPIITNNKIHYFSSTQSEENLRKFPFVNLLSPVRGQTVREQKEDDFLPLISEGVPICKG